MSKRKYPKLVITDIDGVWTDGGMYYDAQGNELKKFSTYDGEGVTLCHNFNIPVAIITGENTPIVEFRAKKLKIDYLFMGITDKVKTAKELCNLLKIDFSEVAYIGDDLNDIELLKIVGISGCPQNAVLKVKKNCKYHLKTKGGYGVFREFIEKLLRAC